MQAADSFRPHRLDSTAASSGCRRSASPPRPLPLIPRHDRCFTHPARCSSATHTFHRGSCCSTRRQRRMTSRRRSCFASFNGGLAYVFCKFPSPPPPPVLRQFQRVGWLGYVHCGPRVGWDWVASGTLGRCRRPHRRPWEFGRSNRRDARVVHDSGPWGPPWTRCPTLWRAITAGVREQQRRTRWSKRRMDTVGRGNALHLQMSEEMELGCWGLWTRRENRLHHSISTQVRLILSLSLTWCVMLMYFILSPLQGDGVRMLKYTINLSMIPYIWTYGAPFGKFLISQPISTKDLICFCHLCIICSVFVSVNKLHNLNQRPSRFVVVLFD
jgi:hypothetical protein